MNKKAPYVMVEDKESVKAFVIHLRSDETITYLLSDIENISFK